MLPIVCSCQATMGMDLSIPLTHHIHVDCKGDQGRETRAQRTDNPDDYSCLR